MENANTFDYIKNLKSIWQKTLESKLNGKQQTGGNTAIYTQEDKESLLYKERTLTNQYKNTNNTVEKRHEQATYRKIQMTIKYLK